jgi:hypothetical protein
LRSMGSVLLSRRLKPVLKRNSPLGRWPEGQLYPITIPLRFSTARDAVLLAVSEEASC